MESGLEFPVGDGVYWAALFDDASEGLEDSMFLRKVLDLAKSFIFHWKIL